MTTPDRSPTLQAAVDELFAAEDALDTRARLDFAMLTLKAGAADSGHPAETRAFWIALHTLINSGATPERVDHLISVLEVTGPELRQALVLAARRAVDGDQPRAAVWLALQHLADAVVE